MEQKKTLVDTDNDFIRHTPKQFSISKNIARVRTQKLLLRIHISMNSPSLIVSEAGLFDTGSVLGAGPGVLKPYQVKY